MSPCTKGTRKLSELCANAVPTIPSTFKPSFLKSGFLGYKSEDGAGALMQLSICRNPETLADFRFSVPRDRGYAARWGVFHIHRRLVRSRWIANNPIRESCMFRRKRCVSLKRLKAMRPNGMGCRVFRIHCMSGWMPDFTSPGIRRWVYSVAGLVSSESSFSSPGSR